MKHTFIQFLIGLDQLINTLVWAKMEGTGYADETLSARMWRLRSSRNWGFAQSFTDAMFMLLFKQQHHCYMSFIDEIKRHQLPLDYKFVIKHQLDHLPEIGKDKEV